MRNEKNNVISREKTRKVREIFYLKGAPNLSKKVHKKFAKTLSQKSTIFLVKGTQFLTPKQILLHFQMSNYAVFFSIFLPKKRSFLDLTIPRFSRLFSSWGISRHLIPRFLVSRHVTCNIWGAKSNSLICYIYMQVFFGFRKKFLHRN